MFLNRTYSIFIGITLRLKKLLTVFKTVYVVGAKCHIKIFVRFCCHNGEDEVLPRAISRTSGSPTGSRVRW
jgi:hypothetical protein